MGKFERINRYLVRCGIESWPGPFRGPGSDEIPLRGIISLIVHQNDRTVFPGIFYLSIHHLFMPFPEIEVIGYSALERDIGEFFQARQFGYCDRLVIAHPVVNRICCGVESRHFTKTGSLNTADLNSEFKSPKRIVTFSRS